MIEINNKTNENLNEYYTTLEKVINFTLKSENVLETKEVSLSFVSNTEIQQINNRFRNINKITDVLSFPLDDDYILGDIIICVPRAKEQSIEYGHSFLRELSFLTVHSVLHLLGYDHMNEEEENIMINKQKDILKQLKIER